MVDSGRALGITIPKRAPAVEVKTERDALIAESSPYFVGNNRAALSKFSATEDPASLIMVYLAILGHVNKDSGKAFPSRERLAKLLEVSTKTISRATKELASRGLIIITRSPVEGKRGHFHNIYRPVYDTEGLSESDVRSIASLTGMSHKGHADVPHKNGAHVGHVDVLTGHDNRIAVQHIRDTTCPPACGTPAMSHELMNIKSIQDKLQSADEVIEHWLAYAWKHGQERPVANEDDLATALSFVARGVTAAQLEHAVIDDPEAPRLAQAARRLLS